MEEKFEIIRWRLLFRSVLKQAAHDAFLSSKSKEKKDALLFLHGCQDLEVICDIADVDYDKIVSLSKTDEMSNYILICNVLKKKNWY